MYINQRITLNIESDAIIESFRALPNQEFLEHEDGVQNKVMPI